MWPTRACAKRKMRVGDAGGVEQLAGENEERHGQQWEAVDARRHALHDDGERHDGVDHEVQQRAARQREADRHLDGNEDPESRKHQEN